MDNVRAGGDTSDHDLAELLGAKVAAEGFPCLGARSVFQRGGATVRVYETLAGPQTAAPLLADLSAFAGKADVSGDLVSFVAAFRGPGITDEEHFERLLWTQLQAVTDIDGTGWNPNVSSNPGDDNFGFSAAGTAFFIVGLHPRASRLARRSDVPILVFNLHEQFEAMRESGHYARMRDTIRRRDHSLQGSINPVLTDHGELSEARQYSGRDVGPDWFAPFVGVDERGADLRSEEDQPPAGTCPR